MSALCRVEVPSALWRKQRVGELSAADAGLLARAFERDFHGTSAEPPRFSAVTVDAAVLEDAVRLVGAHAVRACDAVQLACALTARAADPGCASFACFDQRLRVVAAVRGFELLPE